MVTIHSKSVTQPAAKSRFIYVTGCDGTGKTTQANLTLDYLRRQQIEPHHLWLRFPFFLTLPLLLFARWRGYSWYEEVDGIRQGYWNFQPSWLLRTFFGWVLLIDATLASLIKVHLPILLGRTIVCERFVLDMLVDLAVAFQTPTYYQRLPGRLFLHLLPKQACIIILDLDYETLRTRRPDLQIDKHLEPRLLAFRHLAFNQALPTLSSTLPIATLQEHIQSMIKREGER